MCPHRKIYKECRHKAIMAYTEVRNINGKKYYYRVISIRKGKQISKKRRYLGYGLSNSELLEKEKKADEQLLSKKLMKTNKEIEKIKPKIIKILKRNKVKRAGIFGSYSRGEQIKNSDIDILVEIKNKKVSLLGFIHIKHELEDALGRKVDLVEYAAIKPLIKDRVLAEEVRILWKGT